MDWPLEVDWSCDCTQVACPLDHRGASLPSITLLIARAYENVFWLDDRGNKGPCRRVETKLMSRRARWNGAEPLHLRKNLLSLETLSALCVPHNRRKAHSNTSSTAIRHGTIDSRDAMASRSCDCTHIHAPVGNRNTSLLSMVCLASTHH